MNLLNNLLLKFQKMDKTTSFRISLNFVNFFLYFLVLLFGLMIFNHYTKGNLSKLDFPPLLNYPSLSMQNVFQILYIGDISRILVILGLFIGYFYFFHYLSNCGVNLLSSSTGENKKMGISFFYAFMISLILTFAILIGAFSGYFGTLTPINLMEVVTLTYLLIILMLTLLSISIIIGD